MQILQYGPTGSTVGCRDRRWRVGALESEPAALMLDLHAANAGAGGTRLRVLHPPDTPVVMPTRWRTLSRRAWVAATVSALRSAWRAEWPRTGPFAHIDPLPYQWVVAAALLSSRTRHVLLADAVGLGKTVQAALAVAELHARDMTARSLIVVPASLLAQWETELDARFHLNPCVLDAAGIRTLADFGRSPALAAGRDVCLVSMDMLRLPEVAACLSRMAWTLLVVDEAHLLAPGTARRAAIQTMLPSVAQLLLLTATPFADTGHDPMHLLRLRCGAAAGRMLVIARPGDVLARPALRQRVVRVHPSTVETSVQAHIMAYLGRARADSPEGSAGRLAALTLARRANSSVDALRHSLRRRIAVIGQPIEAPPAQPNLPLDVEGDEADEEWLRVPAWSDVAAERAYLQVIADALGSATMTSKLHWIGRWLRRAGEPAVVFTEYVDTLRALQREVGGRRRVVCLHGAQTAEQRRLAVERFTTGAADLLLATDAAAEGLNLHHQCRLVLHVEVPWSPRRLAQRNGRVDRLGQTRPVRSLLLVNSPGYDDHVLRALERKRWQLDHLDLATCDDIAVSASSRRARLAAAALDTWQHARGDTDPGSPDGLTCCVLSPGRWHRLRRRLGLAGSTRGICIAEIATAGGHPLAGATCWVAWRTDRRGARAAHHAVALTLPAVRRFVKRRQAISDRFSAIDDSAVRAASRSVTLDLFGHAPTASGSGLGTAYLDVSPQVVGVWEVSCRG